MEEEEQGERSFTVSDRRFSARHESEDRPSERSQSAAFSLSGQPRHRTADEPHATTAEG